MAKMNKVMPPRNTTIRGQDHLLAYITPKEAQMLMDKGGSGKAGPMGIPAFDDADEIGDAIAEAVAFSDEGAGYDYSDFYTETPNVKTGFSDYAITNPNQDARNAVAEQLAIQRAYKKPKPGPGILGSLFENRPRNMMNLLQAKAGQFMMPRIDRALQDNLMNPVYGFNNRVTGAADKYGNLIEGTDPLSSLRSTREAGGIGGDVFEPEVKPVDPETGQCDEGYMFDEDMQACRLAPVAMAESQAAGGVMAQPGDAYARMGLLDVAPTGLPQFQQRYGAGFGSPSDFAAANTAFRRQGAYRPEYFDQPYPTTGYTLLS
jgi:hypothetical protein